MKDESEEYKKAVDRLTSNPEKYAKIREILLQEIREYQGIIEQLDKIIDQKNDRLKKLN
jgi:hypothetical protein